MQLQLQLQFNSFRAMQTFVMSRDVTALIFDFIFLPM